MLTQNKQFSDTVCCRFRWTMTILGRSPSKFSRSTTLWRRGNRSTSWTRRRSWLSPAPTSSSGTHTICHQCISNIYTHNHTHSIYTHHMFLPFHVLWIYFITQVFCIMIFFTTDQKLMIWKMLLRYIKIGYLRFVTDCTGRSRTGSTCTCYWKFVWVENYGLF